MLRLPVSVFLSPSYTSDPTAKIFTGGVKRLQLVVMWSGWARARKLDGPKAIFQARPGPSPRFFPQPKTSPWKSPKLQLFIVFYVLKKIIIKPEPDPSPKIVSPTRPEPEKSRPDHITTVLSLRFCIELKKKEKTENTGNNWFQS